MWQDSKGKFSGPAAGQYCEDNRCLRMGEGGLRPLKLENPNVIYIFVLTHSYLKLRYSSKKDCKNLVMVKMCPKMKYIITDLHHV